MNNNNTCYYTSLLLDKEELADDEKLLDEAVGNQVFTLILQEAVIGCNGFHQEEYFVRHFHWMVTTFITIMPLKVEVLVQ